jgi:hypothetical protein
MKVITQMLTKIDKDRRSPHTTSEIKQPTTRQSTKMKNIYELNYYLNQINAKWQQERYQTGRLHGSCPARYDNENIGHPAPCPYYHAGYIAGRFEYELKINDVPPEDWKKGDWVLIGETDNALYPLSSPTKFALVPKNTLY